MTRTLVVSDLHLGTRAGVDVLRRPAALDALVAALDGIDRVVLLGDALELRQSPVADVLERVEPVLRRLGEGLVGRVVTIVPGNHDHALLGDWLTRRVSPLALEQRCDPAQASFAAGRVAAMLAPAQVELAYPGLWLADGVYATHGHYLDLHMTVPTLERLTVAVSGRLTLSGARRWDDAHSPADYEDVLAPPYAWAYAAAQSRRASDAVIGAHTVRAWNTLRRHGTRTRWRSRALATMFPLAVRAVNAAGLGPVRRELSADELRRAGLRAMSEVVERLAIDARHVVFGHTHRAGMLDGDEPAEWLTPNGTQLHNTGSWVYSQTFSRNSAGPYWPGSGILVEDGLSPRRVALLGDRDAATLAPASS